MFFPLCWDQTYSVQTTDQSPYILLFISKRHIFKAAKLSGHNDMNARTMTAPHKKKKNETQQSHTQICESKTEKCVN